VYLHFPRAEKGAGTYIPTQADEATRARERSYITLFPLLLLFYRSRGKIDLWKFPFLGFCHHQNSTNMYTHTNVDYR
jgi:hypothetical protein